MLAKGSGSLLEQFNNNFFSCFAFALDFQRFDLDVVLFVGDLPARSKCSCINSHLGYHACSHCLFSGVRCDKHKHTLYPWSEFRSQRPRRRTQTHIFQCIKDIEKSRNLKNSYGVISLSPLFTIISIPDQMPFDYFHLCYEIHMPLIMKKWMTILSKECITQIDEYFFTISYPHSFNRYPKRINYFLQWKASEMRVFTLYACLPVLIHLKEKFPAVLITHFSLFFVYIRTLRHFESWHHVMPMIHFIEAYLYQFESLYTRCAEYLSTHALIHLYDQCFDHGSLSSHSMFSTESYLHHISKLSHGSIAIGEQIAYWHTINRYLHLKTTKFSSNLFKKRNLICDNFFNLSIRHQYQEAFDECFLRIFGVEANSKIQFFSRYERNFLIYHSLSYSNRKRSNSFIATVQDNSSCRNSSTAEMLFFFRSHDEDFVFFRKLSHSTLQFSSLISTHDNVPQWNKYLDYYYYFVKYSSTFYDISRCDDIIRKCILFPFNENLRLCTEVELEIEHD